MWITVGPNITGEAIINLLCVVFVFISIEFVLDEAGDIRWKLHHTPSDCLPFLTCDSYEFTPCPNFKVGGTTLLFGW